MFATAAVLRSALQCSAVQCLDSLLASLLNLLCTKSCTFDYKICVIPIQVQNMLQRQVLNWIFTFRTPAIQYNPTHFSTLL